MARGATKTKTTRLPHQPLPPKPPAKVPPSQVQQRETAPKSLLLVVPTRKPASHRQPQPVHHQRRQQHNHLLLAQLEKQQTRNLHSQRWLYPLLSQNNCSSRSKSNSNRNNRSCSSRGESEGTDNKHLNTQVLRRAAWPLHHHHHHHPPRRPPLPPVSPSLPPPMFPEPTRPLAMTARSPGRQLLNSVPPCKLLASVLQHPLEAPRPPGSRPEVWLCRDPQPGQSVLR